MRATVASDLLVSGCLDYRFIKCCRTFCGYWRIVSDLAYARWSVSVTVCEVIQAASPCALACHRPPRCSIVMG